MMSELLITGMVKYISEADLLLSLTFAAPV